jgi:hypothetical protein
LIPRLRERWRIAALIVEFQQAFLTTAQKKNKYEHRKRNSQKPQNNVAHLARFILTIAQVHIDPLPGFFVLPIHSFEQ